MWRKVLTIPNDLGGSLRCFLDWHIGYSNYSLALLILVRLIKPLKSMELADYFFWLGSSPRVLGISTLGVLIPCSGNCLHPASWPCLSENEV